MPTILVAACSGPKRIIGHKNQLPWNIPEEMKDFRSYTLGKTILMGRKTYEGLGRILPNRRNIMLTRHPETVRIGDFPTKNKDNEWYVDGGEKGIIEIATSVEQVKNKLAPEETLLVLGGTEIYRLYIDRPDTMIRMSEIHDIHEGDTSFPEFKEKYTELSRENRGAYDLVWYESRSQESSL